MDTTTDTFTNYIRRQRDRDDPVGDFARDWFGPQPTIAPKPRGSYSWRAVRAYLESNNASEKAIQAGRRAWCEWIKAAPDPAVYELPELLVKHGVIDQNSIADAVNFDGGITLKAVQNVVGELASMLTLSTE